MEEQKFLAPKNVRQSSSEMAEIVMPNDTNAIHNLLGGRLMHWIDVAGGMAAHRHSGSIVVTASIDKIDFLVPVQIGDLVVLKSSINRAFHTSMEAGVKVWVEDYRTGERRHVSSAYLTFVAIDGAGRKQPVPPLAPENAEEKRRYDDAARRREIRQAEKQRLQERRRQVKDL